MQLWKKRRRIRFFFFFPLKETEGVQREWPLQTCHNSYISNPLSLLHEPSPRSLLIKGNLR